MRQNEVKTWLHGRHSIYLGDNNTFKHLETQPKLFEKATNIKYNKTKCIGMWLGSNRGNNTKPMGFKWTSQKIKILGYTYSPDTNVKYKENWEKVRKRITWYYKKMATLKASTDRKKDVYKPKHA